MTFLQFAAQLTRDHIRLTCDRPGCEDSAELAGLCVRHLEEADEARAERWEREREEDERRDFES